MCGKGWIARSTPFAFLPDSCLLVLVIDSS